MNDCSTLLAIICYICLSQTNILFAFVLFCCCFLEADQEEDESKKRQVALICGACAGVVIIVVSLTAVIRTHSNGQVQDGG